MYNDIYDEQKKNENKMISSISAIQVKYIIIVIRIGSGGCIAALLQRAGWIKVDARHKAEKVTVRPVPD